MIVSVETFRARLKNCWTDRKALIMEEAGYSLQDKFNLLRAWVDGVEEFAAMGGIDTAIVTIIDEVTSDTLAGLAEALREKAQNREPAPAGSNQTSPPGRKSKVSQPKT